MDAQAKHYCIGAIAVEERGLRHGDPAALPAPARDELLQRGAGGAVYVGRCKRLAIRPNFDLSLYDFSVTRAHSSAGATGPCLSLSVLLDGAGEGWLQQPGSSGAKIAYRPDTTYLFLARGPARGGYDLPAGCRFHLAELRFELAFLERLDVLSLFERAGSSHPLHCDSADGVWIGTTPTPPAMKAAALALLDAGFRSEAQDLTIEARALDLLSGALALMRGTGDTAEGHGFTGRDLRRLTEARDLLLAEPARPWTIHSLARRVGLNDKKLKRGFRACFGQPVHAFLQEARLSLGRRLLREGGSVTEVSLAVGYANPSHFAQLFRRSFGVTPSAFRQKPWQP